MWIDVQPKLPLLDTFENYEGHRAWFFMYYLLEAAELCRDKEYIKARYHPNEGKVNVEIGKQNDQTKERVALQ